MSRTKGNSKMQMVTFHSNVTTLKITSKKCNDCGDKKDIDDFQLKSNNADGHGNTCKECIKKRQAPRNQRRKAERLFDAQFSPI